jgi:hypothetical protein
VNIPTSFSCHALEQVKVISCVLVSFCCGLDLIDSLGHPLTNEAENKNSTILNTTPVDTILLKQSFYMTFLTSDITN